METIQFSDFNLEYVEETVKTIVDGKAIEIRSYLPVQKKFELISQILNRAVAPDRPYFYDPGLYSVFFDLYTIQAYSNIQFSEDELSDENVLHTYDVLWTNSDVASAVLDAIPREEIGQLHKWASITMDAIITHTQSAQGVLESFSQDYSNLNLDIDEIKKNLTDPDALKTLKEIAPVVDKLS